LTKAIKNVNKIQLINKINDFTEMRR